MQEAAYLTEDEHRLQSAMQAIPAVEAVYQTTMQAEGDSSEELRQGIMNYANNPSPELLQHLPEMLQDYIQKVVEESYKVTDGDIVTMRDNGYSEDFIFEITVVAALGSGLHRFRSGIEALG